MLRELAKKGLRLLGGVEGVDPRRVGACDPTKCSTPDGVVGAACCRLGYTCPALAGTSCGIYLLRPPNCRIFPRTPADLQLVRGCGYSFL